MKRAKTWADLSDAAQGYIITRFTNCADGEHFAGALDTEAAMRAAIVELKKRAARPRRKAKP